MENENENFDDDNNNGCLLIKCIYYKEGACSLMHFILNRWDE